MIIHRSKTKFNSRKYFTSKSFNISIINSDVTANVAISQTVNTPVNVGNKITYTVTAKNNGPNTASGIMINDVLPSGFTATPSVGTFYNNIWVIPNLASGSSATLIISGIATSNMAGTTIDNTATETAQDQYISNYRQLQPVHM